MAKLKMALTLPATVDVEKFFDAVLTQVKGRYGNDRYFDDIAAPKAELRNYAGRLKGGYAYKMYDIDAAELEPATISVINDFKAFVDLDFDFRVDGKSVHNKTFWQITPDEMLDEGHEYGFETNGYDATSARYAAEIYQNKISIADQMTA